MQIAFVLYIGLAMLSYGFNKYSRTMILLAQLSLLFQNSDVSWSRDVHDKLGKLLQAYRKTILAARPRLLSNAKQLTMPSPHEFSPRKGTVFFSLWCRYIVMRKLATIIRLYQDTYRNKPEHALFSMKLLNDKDKVELNSPLYIPFYAKKSFSLFQVNMQLDTFKTSVMDMHKMLSMYAYFFLNQVLTPPERTEIYVDVEKVLEKNGAMDSGTYLKFGKFFKSQAKLTEFKKFYINVDTNVKELKINALAGDYHRPEDMLKGAPRSYHGLYQEGIDLYRGRGDVLAHEIAIDCCSGEFMALAVGQKGSREINVQKCLQFRNRSLDGLKLLDEEIDDWDTARNRFPSNIEQYSDNLRPPPIEAVVRKLFPEHKAEFAFPDFDSVRLLEWNHRNAEEYYVESISDLKTHNEPAYSVVSHPHLGLYITGSSRGRLHFWKYNSGSNAAVNEYVTDPNWKDNSGEAWNVIKLRMNGYGDKLAASDFDGSLYMFNLSAGQEGRDPSETTKKASFGEFLDFDFLDQGTVICATGLKPTPHLTVLDMLMPPSQRAVIREAMGGNIVLGLHDNRQILLFNSRQQGMHMFDIRARKFFDQFLNSETVTAACFNKDEDTLVTGHPEGTIKVWNANVGYSLREQLSAFEGGRARIRQLAVTPDNTLYACGSDGHAKLLRPYI